MSLAQPVTQTHVDQYRNDGVTLIKGAVNAKTVARLLEAIDATMKAPRKTANFAGGEGGSGRFFTDTNMWRDIEAFRKFEFSSPVAQIAAEMMGARKINLYNEHLLVKEPGSGASPTPWHQDQPYFRTDGKQVCSAWIALDYVDRSNGAMSFVRGSHLWNKMYQPVSFTSARKASADDFDGPVPEIDESDHDVISFDLEPGDCTIHHGLTLHGAPGNTTPDRWRRALSLRYTGDDVTFVERSWHPTANTTKLTPGDPIDCDDFPVIWQEKVGLMPA